ncbi:MAG: YegS/Rv2252/BmrU family lipid kinase [Cyanophyceae cyanobacterium]
MSRTACLIFNPVAGQSDPDQDLDRIKLLLEPNVELDIRMTTEEVGADRLAKEAVERQAEAIIVSGGDGTLSAAAEALVETDIPMGVISRGTANAFAAALKLPDTIEEACQAILEGKTKKIDVARCNGQPMVLLAGVGFEAETVKNTTRQSKKRWGAAAYILSGMKNLPEFETFEVEIETDDKVIRGINAGAVTVANAAPPTSILAQGPGGIVYDDGLLDVTIVAITNLTGAIGASYHLLQTALQGNPAKRDDIAYLRTNRLKVTTNPPQKVAIDGEIAGDTPIDVECIPEGLTVFFQATAEEKVFERLEGLPNIQVEPKPN